MASEIKLKVHDGVRVGSDTETAKHGIVVALNGPLVTVRFSSGIERDVGEMYVLPHEYTGMAEAHFNGGWRPVFVEEGRVLYPPKDASAWSLRRPSKVDDGKPLVIVFEGNDGAGKSTQLKLLSQALVKVGIPHAIANTPGSGALGQQLRNILLHDQSERSWTCEALLFQCARQTIIEAVRSNQTSDKPVRIVLIDRFDSSNVAYQGGCDVLRCGQIFEATCKLGHSEFADVEFFFQVDYESAQKRMAGKKADVFESRGRQFFTDVNAGYEYMYDVISPKRTVIKLDTAGSIEAVADEVMTAVCGIIAVKFGIDLNEKSISDGMAALCGGTVVPLQL